MMRLCSLLVLAGFFLSCAPHVMKTQIVFVDQEPFSLTEETTVEVAVLPKDLVFLDVSRWGRSESQMLPQDRLMENIDQLIERERQTPGEGSAWREAELLRLKGDVVTGIAHSDALDRLAGVLLQMEETAQEGAFQRDLLRMDKDDPREQKEAVLNYYISQYDREFRQTDDEAREVHGDSLTMHRLVVELCNRIDEEAWRQGFRSLLHSYVMKSVVLQPSRYVDQELFFQGGGELTGYCQPIRDEFTGKFVHNARFTAKLVPLRRFAGVIDALQDDQTMAGMGSRAYVTLLEPGGFQAPLPVLIVQHQDGLSAGFVKVVGSGVITQLFGNQGQLEILESTKEITHGDHFFIVQVQGQLVQDEDTASPFAPGVWRGIPVETVQPSTE